MTNKTRNLYSLLSGMSSHRYSSIARLFADIFFVSIVNGVDVDDWCCLHGNFSRFKVQVLITILYGIYWLATNAKYVPFAFVSLHQRTHTHSHVPCKMFQNRKKTHKIFVDDFGVFNESSWKLPFPYDRSFVPRNEWHLRKTKYPIVCMYTTLTEDGHFKQLIWNTGM